MRARSVARLRHSQAPSTAGGGPAGRVRAVVRRVARPVLGRIRHEAAGALRPELDAAREEIALLREELERTRRELEAEIELLRAELEGGAARG